MSDHSKKESASFDANMTYCNPIPLPDYPIGRYCYTDKNSGYSGPDFREAADPTVIFEDGVWYLYPSCGMVYWSEDYIHWNHKKMIPYDCGYAPTVVKHRKKYYLMACQSPLYISDHPMGPFEELGYLMDPDGEEVRVNDPMLFSDEDGRMYLYCGCGGSIKGVELDSNNPRKMLTALKTMFEMNTTDHPWERMGDWNEDGSYSWMLRETYMDH